MPYHSYITNNTSNTYTYNTNKKIYFVCFQKNKIKEIYAVKGIKIKITAKFCDGPISLLTLAFRRDGLGNPSAATDPQRLLRSC